MIDMSNTQDLTAPPCIPTDVDVHLRSNDYLYRSLSALIDAAEAEPVRKAMQVALVHIAEQATGEVFLEEVSPCCGGKTEWLTEDGVPYEEVIETLNNEIADLKAKLSPPPAVTTDEDGDPKNQEAAPAT